MREDASKLASAETAEPSDPELVEGCLAREPEAWNRLIARYQRLIYSIPVQAGMDRADAAEVFQAVCVTLFRRLSTLRDHQTLAKWLITTTTRESWRLARSRRKDANRLSSSDSAEDDGYQLKEIADRLPLPDEKQLVLEKQQIIFEAVNSLPDKCRDLITLLFLRSDEPPYEEIGTQMGMPESSIGPTRARCLQKLKKLLEGKL